MHFRKSYKKYSLLKLTLKFLVDKYEEKYEFWFEICVCGVGFLNFNILIFIKAVP